MRKKPYLVQGHSEEDIAKNKKKVELRNKKFNLEQDIQSKEMCLQLVNMSKEFLDRHSEIQGEIAALREQNKAYLTQKSLQEAKAAADELLKQAIADILREIENTLNTRMKEINDSLFSTPRKPPHIQFRKHDSYKFETPDDTGTGSNETIRGATGPD